MIAVLIKYWPILFRAGLYVALESLPVLYIGVEKIGKGEVKFNGWLFAGLLINSAYHGCVGLRAYTDTSFHRISGEIKQRGDTSFLVNPQTQNAKTP